MSIHFDFLAPDVYASASAIAGTGSPGTATTLCTIPLATAAFPLQSGRVVVVVAEFAGQQSSGEPLFCSKTETFSSSGGIIYHDGNCSVGGTTVGQATFTLNGSSDLEVQWTNYNTALSGITHDISVRVTLRWVGA